MRGKSKTKKELTLEGGELRSKREEAEKSLYRSEEDERKRAVDALPGMSRYPEKNPNPVMRVSAGEELLYANRPAIEMLRAMGWQKGGSLPDELRRSIRGALEKTTDQGFELLSPRGQVFSFALSARDEKGYVNIYALDVTARKQAEDNILRQNRIQESINQIFQNALTCDTENELGSMCLTVVERLTASKFGFIGEIARDGYFHDIAVGDPGGKLCTMDDSTGHRRPPGEFKIHGLYGRVLHDGQSLLTNDPGSHPDSIKVPAGHPHLTAFLGAPFIQEGKTIGLVAVGNRDGGYTQEQARDLEALVPVIFQALLRKRAEEGLRQSELKYRIVAENPYDWEFWFSPEGKFIYVSPSCKRITGLEPEDFIRDPSLHRAIVFPEDLPLFDHHRHEEEVISREVQFRIVHTDGTIRWIGHVCKHVFDEEGRYLGVRGSNRDITERKQGEANQGLLTDILQIFNLGGDLRPLIGRTLRLIRRVSGFDAVGLRLRQGGDFPYFESNGFSEEFLREETFLCAKGVDGAVVQDTEGRAVLECTCGLVLSGRTDPNMSCFTRGGSFWTNASNELLALPRQADPRTNPRNRCIHTGYESVGLFPVRSGREIVGLLQLNDRRGGRFTPGVIVFYETLAQNISLALQRAAAEEGLRQRSLELQQLNETLEHRIQERTKELRQSQRRLQHLASQLLVAEEKERKRIANELHDSLLSELAAMKFLFEAKMNLLMKGDLADPSELNHIADIMKKVINDTREIMNNLRPSILDEMGLIPTIGWLSKEYQKAYSHIQIRSQVEASEKDIPDAQKVVIFRVLQEALNNSVKHGGANRVDLSLLKTGDKLHLRIQDNGQGFDVGNVQKGLGLESMRERVEFSGGEFQIESGVGRGTTIGAIWGSS